MNHVVRKWSDPVDAKANLAITVPGGSDGPGGVLVCSENWITYKNQGHADVKVSIPRRAETPLNSRGILITTFSSHKQKDKFFFLLQSELGDLYKLTLSYDEEAVRQINIRYFDTVPIATSLCVMKTGFLFVAAESGNHILYQFQSLAEDEDPLDNYQLKKEENMNDGEGAEVDSWSYFQPRALKNLAIIDEMDNLSPVIDMKIEDIAREETPQIYALCGKGTQSTVRILRHGLPVSEMAVSPLPGNPAAVWTVKKHVKDPFDKYIVISFLNLTLVLAIGETVEQATDSGLIESTPSIHVSNIGEDAIIQVHPLGIRHISGSKGTKEWKTPGKKTVVKATSNERQVVLALSGGDIIYFELDSTGSLVDVGKKFIGREIASVDLAPIPEGKQRSKFLAVGELSTPTDSSTTVRIFSLDPEDILQSLSVQALPPGTTANSLAIVQMRTNSVDATGSLFLTIGLNNGVLLRCALDSITGELTDTRTRYIGSRSVKLFKVSTRGANSLLALSSRPWLGYNYQSRYHFTPLSYGSLEYASHFASEQCPEGIVAITGNTLRIISIERLGEVFNQRDIPLLHTPRKFIIHPQTGHLIIIESDYNSSSTSDKVKLRGHSSTPTTDNNVSNSNNSGQHHSQSTVTSVPSHSSEDVMEVDMETEDNANATMQASNTTVVETVNAQNANLSKEERMFGIKRSGPGRWGSCIRLLDTMQNKTLDVLELTENECAVSICTCVFHDTEGEVFIIVGTVKDWVIDQKTNSGGFIHVYRLVDGRQLQLYHKTAIEGIPAALCPFQGRLLVGAGKALRIYDLGKKKMLRKCETKTFPYSIIGIHTQGDRIYVSDVQESIQFVKYKKSENQFYTFADEFVPRWLTSTIVLDYDTICGTDKFGNLFVSRLSSSASDEIEADPTGAKAKIEQGYLNGAPHKLEDVVEFYLGETSNAITKASLAPGGAEAIIYITMLGTIGALVPFTSREDVDFFSHLEMHLRQEHPPLCGRDHLAFRSYYFAVKGVIDGDLCEQFAALEPEKQKQLADELDRSPAEVLKKLEGKALSFIHLHSRYEKSTTVRTIVLNHRINVNFTCFIFVCGGLCLLQHLLS